MGLIGRWLQLQRDPAQAALPTAREEHRGMLRVLSGDGTSTRDKLYLGRDSSGTKAWVEIVNDTDTQTLANKTLTSPTILSPDMTVTDNLFTLQDNIDTTKKAQFQASGIAAGQTRTLTLPDANTSLVGTDAIQALTNKTVSGNTNTISVRDNNFTLFDNTDATKQVQFDLVNISAGTTRVLILPNVTAVELVATTGAQTLSSKTLTAPTLNDAILGNAIETTGTTPGIAASANAGTTASVSITGNDTCGLISLTPGGAGIGGGNQLTVTFANARPDTNYAVMLQAMNDGAAGLSSPLVRPASLSTTAWSLNRASVALVSGTVYSWLYWVVEY